MSLRGYLAMEAAETEHRHEYWDGDCWAMTGTTPAHNTLLFVLRSALHPQLSGGQCLAFQENIRTRVSETRYVYPDLVIACPPEFDQGTQPPTLLNPKVVVEILSPSTADFDRGAKLRAYYGLDTVAEVVLVEPDVPEIQHHRRQADGSWLVRTLGPGATLELPSVGARLSMDALYAEVAAEQARGGLT